MPPPRSRVPSYRLHKNTGQAVVTLRTPDGGRRDVYLGAYNSEASRAEYARLIARGPTADPEPAGRPVKTATVAEVLLAFLTHADNYYRRPDGTRTDEVREFRLSCRVVRELYAALPSSEFGPLALKAVRQRMIDAGLSRPLVNRRTNRVKHVFKWAASEELVTGAVYQSLRCLAGLQAGRSAAPETAPVVIADVDATFPFVRPAVAGMIRFQQLTGCRPGEVCLVRPCDLDTTADVWLYRPRYHKLAYRNQVRVIAVGPRAQAVLRDHWPPAPTDHFFSPAREVLGARTRPGRRPGRRRCTGRTRRGTLASGRPRRNVGRQSTTRPRCTAGRSPAGSGRRTRPGRACRRSRTGTRTSSGTPTAPWSGRSSAWKPPRSSSATRRPT